MRRITRSFELDVGGPEAELGEHRLKRVTNGLVGHGQESDDVFVLSDPLAPDALLPSDFDDLEESDDDGGASAFAFFLYSSERASVI